MSGDAGMSHAVFLHGAGAWGGQWAIWQRVFEAAGWTTAAPDRAPAEEGVAATRLADHRLQVLQSLEAIEGRSVLIGASLGGLLALLVNEAASGASQCRAPKALVLVNPLPPAPWARQCPIGRRAGDVLPWHSEGRFSSSQRALPSSSFADQHWAFRHWRDDSAMLLREAAAGVLCARPRCPVLVIASEGDTDVPASVSAAFAAGIGASLLRVAGGHLEPVMGASASSVAASSLSWLNAAPSAA